MTGRVKSGLPYTFSKSSPRPPVPGGGGDEENESTVAEQISSKTRYGHYLMSALHPVSVADCSSGHITSSTKTGFFSKSVPLERGYEPDGCVVRTAKYSEHETRFAERLRQILEDSSGVSYFRSYLSSELSSEALEFWLACTGFRKVEERKLRAVASAIFKKFIARGCDRFGVHCQTKQAIREQLKSGHVELSIFDDAIAELEVVLAQDYLPLFLSSKEYADYLRTKSANVSPSQITSAGQMSPCHCSDDCSSLLCDAATFRKPNQPEYLPKYTVHRQGDDGTVADDSDYCTVGVSISPTRAPVTSIQDSLSSDVLTDETFSLTDSSLSLDDRDRSYFSKATCPYCPNCFHSKGRAVCIKKPGPLPSRLVLRGGNLSEKDPEQFAKLLSERLNEVFRRRENSDDDKCQQFRDGASGVSIPVAASTAITAMSRISAVNTALLGSAQVDEEESAQSILDGHVSRVFDSPDTQQTPTRSVDCRSVIDAEVDHSAPSYAGGLGYTSNSKATDTAWSLHFGETSAPMFSMLPCASSSVDNQTSATSHPHVSNLSAEQVTYGGLLAGCHASNQRPGRDCIASSQPAYGQQSVAKALPRHSQQQPVCNHACAKDKVITWMRVNDQLHCFDGVKNYERTESLASTSKPSVKESRSNAKMDRHIPMPTQPIIQDPMMPLLNPPDPTTQLEEARRRLQLESTTRVPPKSMLYGNNLSLDRDSGGTGMSSSLTSQSLFPASHLLSPQNQTSSRSGSKYGDKHMTSLPSTPMQPPASLMGVTNAGQSTTVVYFLCDEPIPYSTKVPQASVTLSQFKELVAKKGNYRYYFKCDCNDFDTGYVYEEVMDDDATLPLIDGKICAKVVRTA